MKLTFYLFDNSVSNFDEAINPKKFDGDDAFERYNPKESLPFDAIAYFQKNRKTTPKWLSFLTDHFEIDPDNFTNTTNSFLLLVKVKERIFAITAGFGFTAIERNKIERGFGLRVSLNEIDPGKIKGVDVRKIDTTTKQKRVLLNRDSPLYDFDFDVDEDLLNLVSGHPKNEELARKLVGSDSLSLTGDLDFLSLGTKCEALLEAYLKEDYKQAFDFIDNLRLIKSTDLKDELNRILLGALKERSSDKLILAYPEIDNLNQVEHFKYLYKRKSHFEEEVHLESVYSFLDSINISGVYPLKFHIIGLNHEEQAVTKKYNLYDYIVFETEYDNQRYLLMLNQWFEIANDYVEEIDNSVRLIEEITTPNYLPLINKGQREDAYNLFAAQSNNHLLSLDKDNYPAGGYSKIEVCDLLTQERDFICVKKYNGSSTLSHLFSQGVVSATLLNDERAYREFVLGKCPDTWSPIFDVDRPQKTNINFVFAIASDSPKDLVDTLPFFSKVNLRQAHKNIERMGFNVKIYKINYA